MTGEKTLMKMQFQNQTQSKASRMVALLSLELLIAVAGCNKGETKVAAQVPTSVPVVVASVVKKDVPVSVRSIGNVQAFQAVAIRSQINGQITDVHFKQGQDVKAGDLLFTLD